MNLGDTRIVLRPRSMAEVLDLAFPFCARAWRTLLALSALLLLPGLGACALLRWRFDVAWPQVWLVALVAGSVVQGAFTLAAGRLLFEERPRVTALLGPFVRRLPAYLVSLLVTRLLLVLTCWTFVVPLFAWARLLFLSEAIHLEDAGPFRAMGRSSRFVVGRTFEILGMLCAMLAVQASFVVVAELLGASLVRHVFQLGEPVGALLDGGSLYALLGWFVSIPFVAAARFLKYIDVRTRKEGWDIALRFRAIAGDDAERAERRVAPEEAA